jgi:hypothetical protein
MEVGKRRECPRLAWARALAALPQKRKVIVASVGLKNLIDT